MNKEDTKNKDKDKEGEKDKEKDKDKGEEGKAAKTEEKKDSVVMMKKGDYTVHMLIEEIKNFCSIDVDQKPFPIIKVTALGKTERTAKTKIGVQDNIYAEHMYFDKSDLTAEMLDSEKIIIEAYDHKNSKKADYFGIYEFDFEYIYNRPNHAINNLWIALANPEGKDITEVRGYLKLSVSVLHADDPRIELEMKDTEGSDCIVPSQIKIKYRQISVHIFRGEEFPDMDAIISEKKTMRECDGFIELKYLGITRKTKVVKMVKERIEWNEVIDIPVSDPAVSQKIVMIVKDSDKLGDDIVGAIEIKVSDIYAGKYQELTYLDVYGSPVNKKGGVYDQMNLNSEIGSKWRGRVLTKITWKEVETPVAKVSAFEDEEYLKQVASTGRAVQWSVYCKIYDTMFLPTEKDSYGVRICLQESVELLPPRKAENRAIEWNYGLKLQSPALTNNKEELSDIFIYLTNAKGENICFQRVKASYFYMNTDMILLKLLPDPCLGKVNDVINSGIIKMRMCLFCQNESHNINLKQFESGKEGPKAEGGQPAEEEDDDLENLVQKKEVKAVEIPTFSLAAIVYMSKHLIAADSTGTSDPYVTISTKIELKKTSIKYQTVNGIWNERLIFEKLQLDTNDQSTWPLLQVCVVDHNTFKDEMISFSYLSLSDCAFGVNSTELVRPRWHKLTLPKSGKQQGEVLLSFYLFDEQNKAKIDKITYLPETIPYTAHINILGLRQLKPLSIIPVKKAFIKFDMNSLNVTGREEDMLQPIQTLPKDTGANPTINTVFTFDVKLPKDEIFIPTLQCEVYDYMLNGLFNSMLGIFTLNIKDIIRKTKVQIDEDIKVTNQKVSSFLSQGMIKSNILHLNTAIKGVAGDPTTMLFAKKPAILAPPKPQDEQIDLSSKGKGMDEPLIDPSEKPEQVQSGDVKVDMLRKSTLQNQIELTKDFLKQNVHNSTYFVVYPIFKVYNVPGQGKKSEPQQEGQVVAESPQKELLIEDELKAPERDNYFPVGYLLKVDENFDRKEDFTKHYRRIYRKPLEEITELKMKSPFHESKIKRGKYEDSKDETSLFDSLKDIDKKVIKRYIPGAENLYESPRSSINSLQLDQGKMVTDKIAVGKFKGLIRICEKTKMEEYNKALEQCKDKEGNLLPKFKALGKYETLTRNILSKKKLVVRLYVLELNSLAKKDLFSESDPYIKIFIGNTEINEVKNKQDDQKNCKWYKVYDIAAELPGDSTIKLEVWDWDPLMTDDLIGSTMIDLEDRYFDSTWKELEHKPIEVRSLYHPDISGPQGEVYMWLEMHDVEGLPKPVTIAQEPPTHIEMRFVVWETEEMEAMDVEDTSDIYVIGYLNQAENRSTDTHYRCQTGCGSFNWRMLIPIVLPSLYHEFHLDVYDADLFSADDLICGATIDIKSLLNIPKLLDLPIKFTRDFFTSLPDNEKRPFGEIEFMSKNDDVEGIKFWVQCYKNGKKGGRVLCTLELLPQWKADLSKVGEGRKEPNLDPYLPPPVGRFEFSLNPFKMLNQCVGPKFRRKMYCYICLCLLVIYLCAVIPYAIYHISSEALNPFRWFGSKRS